MDKYTTELGADELGIRKGPHDHSPEVTNYQMYIKLDYSE
jgi:hypothetical protein